MINEIKPLIKLRNGIELPRIGFGTWQLRGENAYIATKHAIKCGYTHIDTASRYENEAELSRALNDVHKENPTLLQDRINSNCAKNNYPYPIHIESGNKYKIWITSKAGPHEIGENVTLEAYKRQCKLLNIEKLDLYLLHWPGVSSSNPNSDEHRKSRLAAWKQLEKLYKEEKVRCIGVSNFTIKHLKELMEDGAEIVPFVNQFELHPLIADFDLIKYCNENNIVVEAYSSLGTADSRVLQNDTVCEIAKIKNKSPAQILLRWGLQHNAVILPKSKTPLRIEENLQLFDFELTPQEMEKLNNLNTEKVRVCWDPYTMK